jgi:hypothetical protein
LLLFFSLTLFASATLLFFVQPMIGKMILPRLGGTPAVWNTCMLFFQAMLLIGYAYTHTLSTTQSRRVQLLVQSVLLFLPLIVLPFALPNALPPTDENPAGWLLWVLLGMVGLPFFVVATSAPLLQKWFATTGHPAARDPYFLYGASNLGSMVGLLLYPALLEPAWDVPTQAVIWTVGYGLLIGLVVGCALLVWRTPEPAAVHSEAIAQSAVARVSPTPASSPVLEPAIAATAVTTGRRRGVRLQSPLAPSVGKEVPSIARKQAEPSGWDRFAWALLAKEEPRVDRGADALTFGRRLRWVLLAAAPSSLMLGVTTYLTTDIAAVPLFWVVPLALYLMTFILVFARWPVVWTGLPHTLVLYLQPCFLLFLVLRMVGQITMPTWGEFSLHLLAFFFTTLMCHGELAKDRPSARHLTEFYLWMSVGGVLGGIFNALIAPVALPYGIIEYPLAMVVACLLRPYMAQDVSQARSFGVPRSGGDVANLVADSALFGLGMATYTSTLAPPATEHRSAVARFGSGVLRTVRRIMPGSNLLEIVLDLAIPIAFGVFAYYMVDIGDHQRTCFGITFRRSYLMAATVVLALAMAMRPVRFGLSVGALFLVVTLYDRSYENRVFEDRSFFGLVRVREYDEGQRGEDGKRHVVATRRTLIHGGINHGQQIVWPEPLRRQPITYFHPTNGIGEIFQKLTWGNPPGKAKTDEHRAWMEQNYWTDAPRRGSGESKDDWEARYESWFESFSRLRTHFHPADARLPASLVGLGAVSPWAQLVATQQQPPFAVIGLGTGTLAAHGQPYQHVDFYEIDPMVKGLSVPASGKAEDLIFYYVNDAVTRGATLDIILGDGRLKVKDAPAKYYHAMLLDAFSSDAVPVHLLTKEAIELYLEKLANGGVLIFNTTNRYVRLNPVLARIAEELDLECLACPDFGSDRIPEKFGADWLAMRRRTPGGYTNGGPSLFDRLQVSDDRWQSVTPSEGRAWTDSYSNLLGAMRW